MKVVDLSTPVRGSAVVAIGEDVVGEAVDVVVVTAGATVVVVDASAAVATVVVAGTDVVEDAGVEVNAVWPLTTHSGWYSDAHLIFTLMARVTVPTSLTCNLAKRG